MTYRVRVAAVGALLLLAGCGTPATSGTASPDASAAPSTVVGASATPASTQPSARPAASTSAAPQKIKVPATLDFRATTVDGKEFDGASLAGKPVLFWFWAPWCPTCRGQIDQVQGIARDFDGKVSVVGVGSLDDARAIVRFADDADGLTHLSDVSGAVFRHFKVVQQSSFVLLDADGTQVYSVGYGGSDDLADRVAEVAG